MKKLFFISFAFLLALFSCTNNTSEQQADVIIYTGTSAAAAACKAIDDETAVQDIDYSMLRKTLLRKFN
ncbi:MAG TPA: hypothetical protein VFC65_20835 [Prolixibacteraceae bacterium]|nr:hypothetical protein [Prolixibacteraceae bacterium]